MLEDGILSEEEKPRSSKKSADDSSAADRKAQREEARARAKQEREEQKQAEKNLKLAAGSLGKLQPTLKKLDALVTRLDKFNPDPEDRSALVTARMTCRGWLTAATASAGGEGRPALPFEAETLQARIREWLACMARVKVTAIPQPAKQSKGDASSKTPAGRSKQNAARGGA